MWCFVVLVGVVIVYAVVALSRAASNRSRMEERWQRELEEYDRFPYEKDGEFHGKS